MRGLTRDETSKPVSLGLVLMCKQVQGKSKLPVLLTTTKIGNHIRLVLSLLNMTTNSTGNIYNAGLKTVFLGFVVQCYYQYNKDMLGSFRSIRFSQLVDRIESVRGTLVDVDDSMLDARSTRCSLYADAGKRGCMIWGTSVFRKNVVGPNHRGRKVCLVRLGTQTIFYFCIS